MSFKIQGLPRSHFESLFGLPEEALQARGALRVLADHYPGFPCRVSLEDAQPGESVLLVNYEHLPVATPYRSRYAVYVREGAEEAQPRVNAVPEVLQRRLLSLRGFDQQGMLLKADVVEGRQVASMLEEFLAVGAIDVVHIHNAKPGCFAAMAKRA